MRISLRWKDRIKAMIAITVFFLCMRACTAWIDTTNIPAFLGAIQAIPGGLK
jgi:hypothetical protein